jgi:hypothetical protein
MATVIYTLSEIENICWKAEHLPLPEDTIKIIDTISEQVGAPSYNRTPTFQNKTAPGGGGGNRRKKKNEEINAEDWEAIRTFQKTEIVKKEGIEKEIDSIRLLINKLTEKTYDKIVESMIATLNEIHENGNYNEESVNKIGFAIFNMATSNKFNSNVYARLCSKLLSEYDFMNSIIHNNITEFMKLFDNMVFVSPEENYDAFCDMNIANDKRRSMSLFLTNLYKNNVITMDIVFANIVNIQNILMTNKNDISKKKENEELSENLYTLLTNIPFLILTKHNGWSIINDNIEIIKNSDSTVNLGISSKCKFKHMDISDKLN